MSRARDLGNNWAADITGVTAGTGITGGGTSGTVTVGLNTSSVIPPTIVDAKGDLIAATANDNLSRLAVGSNGTVLTADSTAATGLKWDAISSGGLTLLSTTTLSGTLTTLSSIPNTFIHILLVHEGVSVSGGGVIDVEVNGSASNSSYTVSYAQGGAVVDESNSNTRLRRVAAGLSASGLTNGALWFYNYNQNSNSCFYHQMGNTNYSAIGWGRTSVSINSVGFQSPSGNNMSGTVYLYGVK
jgi:hypothetical protein